MSKWRNRIVGYDEVDPEQLLANPYNARLHPKAQQQIVGGLLDEVGWVQDVLVNQTTGRMVDGHLRVALAIRKGEPKVPVKYVELSEEEEILIVTTLDQSTGEAVIDPELMQEPHADNEAVNEYLQELLRRHGVARPSEEVDSHEQTFWPEVKIRVPPETFEKYQKAMDIAPAEEEHEKFGMMIDAALEEMSCD